MAIEWETFRSWLQANYRQKTWKDYARLCAQYYEYLFDKPLSELMVFKRDKRLHILKALISLSKFAGVYPHFKQRMQAFGIKWQMPSALEIFNHTLSKSREDVSAWAREIASKFPEFKDFLTLAALSGLRKEEALNA